METLIIVGAIIVLFLARKLIKAALYVSLIKWMDAKPSGFDQVNDKLEKKIITKLGEE